VANDILKKFGKFFLLDRIAQGGMAEIYRARLAGEGGAGRILVIKRIQAGFGSNKEFQEMFKSEIQVTMGFNHPNIVQVYDFGEELGQPFIAMELVDGRNLRQLITESRNRQQKIPIDLAAYMIEQSCSGLHYAHTFKDKVTGQPYNIIHRDISPQNIIVSYDGVIKVIDFGIAKANVERENTRAGVIKGKPSYLSPEQVVGDVLDARSDVFSLGIVLWELLTGIKLFKAKSNDNEFVVLKMIESCATYVKPPSRFNNQVPSELDEVVMKSLAKNKNQRYQNADDFRKALRRFLAVHSPHTGNSELSIFMKRLFQNIIIKDRKNLQELNQKAERLLQDITKVPTLSTKTDSSKLGTKRKSDGTMTFRSFTEREKQFEFVESTQDKEKMNIQKVVDVERKRLKQPYKGSAMGPSSPPPYAGPRAGGGRNAQNAHVLRKKKSAFLIKAVATIALITLGAMIFLGPNKFGLKSAFLEKTRSEVLALIGLKGDSSEVIGEEKRAAASDSTSKMKVNESGKIKVQLKVYPEWGQEALVYIDKKRVSGGVFEAPYDKQFSIRIEKPGFKTKEESKYYSSATYSSVFEREESVHMEPIANGYLTLKTFPNADITIVPSGRNVASIFQGGKEVKWVHSTPLEYKQLPVGEYQVKLENKILGLVRSIKVKIEAERETNININLE